MTSKEVKVYLSKQIAMCEEKIELYENVKASKDFIELHKNLLDFYKTIEKDLEVLETLKNNLTIDDNYYSQDNGSTEAIKLCISNCVTVEEDEEYTDECYPNCDYYKVKEWLDNDTK